MNKDQEELKREASEGMGAVLWLGFLVVIFALAMGVITLIVRFADQIDSFTM